MSTRSFVTLQAECAMCCRTARHHIPWNCPGPVGPHGDRHPLADAHNGQASACCNGEWNAACWNTPSADNYEHSCDMCVGGNQFDSNRAGCNGDWTDRECSIHPSTRLIRLYLYAPSSVVNDAGCDVMIPVCDVVQSTAGWVQTFRIRLIRCKKIMPVRTNTTQNTAHT